MARRRFEWDPDPRLPPALEAEARKLDLSAAVPARPGSPLSPPTLIVDSHNDLVWCEGKVEALAANHPGADLLLCEDSGHYPFAEEPERFFAALASFVASLRLS
jgi:pimeloyl-ACP methyl ester carboxylesterase